MIGDTCIFTIVSNNYLHFALTFFESVKKHCPDADLILALCDKRDYSITLPIVDHIIEIEELGIANLGSFIYQYSILELNTAIKPYVIDLLMHKGYKKIIYFDPDILVLNSLDTMLELLDVHNVILTPHLTDLLDDGKRPRELDILRAGSYNLGFIALKTCSETIKLIEWWKIKLYKECIVDLPRNLFVDQKWMDLVPGMFEGVFIQRDPGWNVAYWNLNHRVLETIPDGSFHVNNCPLTFFHFSGFSTNSKTLSKHQDRFDKGKPGSALYELCAIYSESLHRNGLEQFTGIEYAFGRFADSTVVPYCARTLIRTNKNFEQINFFSQTHCPRIHSLLNAKTRCGKRGISLTSLTLSLWKSREDLQKTFPDIDGKDSVGFAEWVIDSAASEAGFSEIYIEPIRDSLRAFYAFTMNSTRKSITSLDRRIFNLAWKKRRYIPSKLRIALYPYVRPIISQVYRTSQQISSDNKIQNFNENIGVNLIGYIHAESGVGEAARSSLRALSCSGLPYTVIDYRLGNISRMDESVKEIVNCGSPYRINLMHVNADQTRIARQHLGEDYFNNRYTIGYWYWELPEFPEFLHFAFDDVDEVWVASKYVHQAISKCTYKPVTLVPPAINVTIEKYLTRSELNISENSFVFLHISDALSMVERKNPLGVAKAFLYAFSSRKDLDVCLILKISNLDRSPEFKKQLGDFMGADSRIHLIEGYLDRNTLNNLINSCDCYVSLHRCEGFGLPLAEAMFLGKPVIATAWSSNCDFMREGNSLMVKFNLIEIEEDIGPYKKGQIWADPDLSDAADKMLHVSQNKKLQADLGRKAAETLRNEYSARNTAEIIRVRLAEIAKSLSKIDCK